MRTDSLSVDGDSYSRAEFRIVYAPTLSSFSWSKAIAGFGVGSGVGVGLGVGLGVGDGVGVGEGVGIGVGTSVGISVGRGVIWTCCGAGVSVRAGVGLSVGGTASVSGAEIQPSVTARTNDIIVKHKIKKCFFTKNLIQVLVWYYKGQAE